MSHTPVQTDAVPPLPATDTNAAADAAAAHGAATAQTSEEPSTPQELGDGLLDSVSGGFRKTPGLF